MHRVIVGAGKSWQVWTAFVYNWSGIR